MLEYSAYRLSSFRSGELGNVSVVLLLYSQSCALCCEAVGWRAACLGELAAGREGGEAIRSVAVCLRSHVGLCAPPVLLLLLPVEEEEEVLRDREFLSYCGCFPLSSYCRA